MKNKTKRTVAFILAMLLCLSLLCACSQTGDRTGPAPGGMDTNSPAEWAEPGEDYVWTNYSKCLLP